MPTSPIEFTRRCFGLLTGSGHIGSRSRPRTLSRLGMLHPAGGFVGYISLAHGSALDFEASEMTLRFTWPSLLPCLGSLRPAVDALDAREGDYLFLAVTPIDGTASITKVGRAHELDAWPSSPEHRLLLEVGVTTREGDAGPGGIRGTRSRGRGSLVGGHPTTTSKPRRGRPSNVRADGWFPRRQ